MFSDARHPSRRTPYLPGCFSGRTTPAPAPSVRSDELRAPRVAKKCQESRMQRNGGPRVCRSRHGAVVRNVEVAERRDETEGAYLGRKGSFRNAPKAFLRAERDGRSCERSVGEACSGKWIDACRSSLQTQPSHAVCLRAKPASPRPSITRCPSCPVCCGALLP